MTHSAEEQTDRRQDRHLRSKGFGRGNADLRTGVHIDAAVAFPRDAAGNVIADAQGPVPFSPALPHRAEGVRRLAALADREHEGVSRHRCVAMTKFTGELYFGRDLRELLDEIFANHS